MPQCYNYSNNTLGGIHMASLVPVFIISSSEALPYANKLRDKFNFQITEHDTGDVRFRCETWQDYFQDLAKGSNLSFWDLLYRKAISLKSQNGYAVALVTYDDQAIIRSSYYKVPRDNVILEYGLFFGTLGPNHMFYFSESTSHPHPPIFIPSDLAGIRYDEFGENIDIDKATSTIIERLLKDARIGSSSTISFKETPSEPSDTKNPYIDIYRYII